MQFYTTQTLIFTRKEKHLGRFVLIAHNQQYRIIISPDKQGSQIDLLHLNLDSAVESVFKRSDSAF